VRDDHQIERIARPVFEQGRLREIGERMIADLNADLHAELFGEILRGAQGASDLLEKVELDQDRG
jgi:hypothetical protein